jgi:phage baseplate assembly protein W
MPSYIGFSTINANKPKTTNINTGIDGGSGSIASPINTGKKYRLVDQPLVIQDFVNSLNIQQGQKVGNPGYGTTLWSFIFEPNTADVQLQLQDEVRRVAGQDPRMILNSVKVYTQEHGILIELELAITPFNNAQALSIFFNNNTSSAYVQ